MSETENQNNCEKDKNAEIKKILPSYDQMVDQIKNFNDASKKQFKIECDEENKGEERWTDIDQKYNYVSILGKRGSGKTSVIRALMNDICNDNTNNNKKNNNIVLPMIIPEKMSPTSTLMSTILGMFKGIVDKLSKPKSGDSKFCWGEEKDDLNEKYQDLLKKYCYIRPEYRQILINQYTSEHNYIYKSSEIFDSDAEFIKAFNEFIYVLIKENNKSNKDQNNFSHTIFIIIDDIDLCAEHCSDIVNTLLAYLGNPHIVTILSGDFDTFTETLVHDFLKRDNLLDGDLLNKRFSDYDTVIESRKKLVYEYLKKIMPPIYRYNVRLWSIKDRCNFKAKNAKGKTLLELLMDDVFKPYNISQMFYYFDLEEKNKDLQIKPIIQTFHLFDDTSRGLENVCDALLRTIEVFDKEGELQKHKQIQLLIETILASNSRYNKYCNYILNNIILSESNDSNIFIDCIKVVDLMEKIQKNESINNYTDSFTIYLFIEFVIRMFKKDNIKENEFYIKIRKIAVLYLVTFPGDNNIVVQYNDQIKLDDLNYVYNSENKIKKSFIYFMFENDIEVVTTLIQIMRKKGNQIKKSLLYCLDKIENGSMYDNIPFEFYHDVICSLNKTSPNLKISKTIIYVGEIFRYFPFNSYSILISDLFEDLFINQSNYNKKIVCNTISYRFIEYGLKIENILDTPIDSFLDLFTDEDEKENVRSLIGYYELGNRKILQATNVMNKFNKKAEEIITKLCSDSLEIQENSKVLLYKNKVEEYCEYVLNSVNIDVEILSENYFSDAPAIIGSMCKYEKLKNRKNKKLKQKDYTFLYMLLQFKLKYGNSNKLNNCFKIADLMNYLVQLVNSDCGSEEWGLLDDNNKINIIKYEELIDKLSEKPNKKKEPEIISNAE